MTWWCQENKDILFFSRSFSELVLARTKGNITFHLEISGLASLITRQYEVCIVHLPNRFMNINTNETQS